MSLRKLSASAICPAVLAGAAGAFFSNCHAAGDESETSKGGGETIKFESGESITVLANRTATTADGTIVDGVMPHQKIAKMKSSSSTIRPDPDKGRFSLGAENDPPIEKWLYSMLFRPIPLLDFPGETPLSEVLQCISAHFNEEHGNMDDRRNRMTFWPDVAELDLEGIASLEDVMVRDISLNGVSLRNALKLIFDQTTEPELTFKIEDGVIMITTRKKIESGKDVYTRAYCVGDLSKVPVAPRDHEGTEWAPDLVTFIVEMTQPKLKWAHRDEEGGAIRMVGDTLVVKQSSIGHRKIVGLLNMLDMARSPPAKPASKSVSPTTHKK